jgi:TIR domain
MNDWSMIPEGSWTLASVLSSGANNGVGPYLASYAINLEYSASLNGELRATFYVPDWQDTGSVGIICRADNLWSCIILYIYAAETNSGVVYPILASYRLGKLKRLAVGRKKMPLENGVVSMKIWYYSGEIKASVDSGGITSNIEVYSSNNPFPGYVGVMRFYDTEVQVRDFQWKNIDKKRTLERPVSEYKWDVFLSHSSADKPKVREIAKALKDEGLRVWFDEEQIDLGERVTEKIEEGLNYSRRVIVCLSPNLGRSNWLRSEYGPYINDEISRKAAVRVIPLVIEAVDIENIPVLLLDKLRVEYGSPDGWNKLLEKLRN